MGKTRILIVEDEGIIALDIEERLSNLGYEICDVASSGEEAIAQAKSLKPDLILMDIMLDGEMDGIAAAQRIQEEVPVPIVYLTAHADAATLSRAMVTDPYGYLLKPFKELDLQTTIELALHRFRGANKRGNFTQKKSPGEMSISLKEQSAELGEVSEQQQKALQLLQHVELFSHLPSEMLHVVASHCRFAEFSTNELIAMEGERKVSGFVVASGRLAMLKSSANGKEFIIELIPPGDPYGLIVALDKDSYAATLKAQVPTTVMFIPRSVVLDVVDSQPDLGKAIIEEVFSRLRSSHDMSRALAHDRVEVRVASALCALLPRLSGYEGSEDSSVAMTRHELADLVGSTPETVIRVTKNMERDGILDLAQNKLIRILDKESLLEVANGE